MSHYDFNSGDESRKNLKGDFHQPNTEESELKFEENEVQFIPVDLHDEKPPFKYSGDLSKPESEKYYSNAELRTIQKFNSLFNKVVVLPSNTLCGRTGTSFSNGDYEDVSVKEEFWKTTEEELGHYEGNSHSDQNVEKADHYSSDNHGSQRKRKTNEMILIEQEQHLNIEQEFLRKKVIFHKLKTSTYLKKYTSFLRVLYENNSSHSEGCNLRMIKTNLFEKNEFITMGNMHENSMKNVLNVTTKHRVNQCNNCMYMYPISTSNNDHLKSKMPSKTCRLEIAQRKNNPRRGMNIVQGKNIKIESYKTANHWNYAKPGASTINEDLNVLKRDVKMKWTKLENFSDINFSEVNFRKIYLSSPEQYTYIVKNIAVVETDLTKSNEILKLSYSSRLASALKRSSKTSSKSLVASQAANELSLKSKENMTMKQASILIIKKLFGRKRSGLPPCDCQDKQNGTIQSEPAECVNKIPQDSMQRVLDKRNEAKTMTKEAKMTEREHKIQQLAEKISVDERWNNKKSWEKNTNSHATSVTATPQNTIDQRKILQLSMQDRIQREKRINDLIKSMSSKYAHAKILQTAQQNTDNLKTISGKTISEQHDQYDKRKQREMRLQRLIEEMRRKQKCVCDPCEKKIDEYSYTDLEICKCESIASNEKLSQQTENFSGGHGGDGKDSLNEIDSENLKEELFDENPEQFLENQQKFEVDSRQSDHKSEADMNFNEDETTFFTESEKSSSAKSTQKLSMQNSDDLCSRHEDEDNVKVDEDQHIQIVGKILSNSEVIPLGQFSDEQKTESESELPTSSSIMENEKVSPHISIAVKVVMETETIRDNELSRDMPKLDALTEQGETSDDDFQNKEQSKNPTSKKRDDFINKNTKENLVPPMSNTSTEDERVSDEEPKRHTTDNNVEEFSEQPKNSTAEKIMDKLPDSSDEVFVVEKPRRPTIEKRINTFVVPRDDELVTEKPEKSTIKHEMDKLPGVSDEELHMEKPRKPVVERKVDELFGPSDEEIVLEKPTTDEPTHMIETQDEIPETPVDDNDSEEEKRKKQFDSRQKEQEFLVEQQIIESISEIDSSSGSVEAGTLELKVKMKTTHSKSDDVHEKRNDVGDMESVPIEMEEKKLIQELTTPPGDDNKKKTRHPSRPEFGSNIRFTSRIDENGEITQQLSLSLSGSDKIGKSRSSDLPDMLPSSNDPSRIKKAEEKSQERSVPLDDKDAIERETVQDKPAELPSFNYPRKIEEKEGKSQKLSFIVNDSDSFEERRSTDQPDFKSTLPKSENEDKSIRPYQKKDAYIRSPEKRGKMDEPAAEPGDKIGMKDESKKKPIHGNEIPEKTSDGKKYKRRTGDPGAIKKKLKSDREEKILPHTTDKGQNTDITQPKYRRSSKTSKIREPTETNKLKMKTVKKKSDEKSRTKKENIGHIRSDSRNGNLRQSYEPSSDKMKVSGVTPPRKLSLKAEKISEKPEYNADTVSDSKQRRTEKKSGIISGVEKTKHVLKKRRKSSDQYSSNGEDWKYKDDAEEEKIKAPDKSKKRRKSSEEYSPNRMSIQKGTDEDIIKAEYESKIRRKSSEKYSVKDAKLKPKDEKYKKLADGRRKSSGIYSLKKFKLKRGSTTTEDGMKSFDTPQRRRILSEQYSPDRGDFGDEKLIQKLKHNISEDGESDIKSPKQLHKRSIDYSRNETKILKDITDESKKYGQEIRSKDQISRNKVKETKPRRSLAESQDFELKGLDEENFRSIRKDGKSFDDFFEYPGLKSRSVSMSSRDFDEKRKDISRSKNLMKVQLNSEYLEILEDVALSKALEMEEILKISFSPKQQTNVSITNLRGENNIASNNIPRYCTPRTGKYMQKHHDSKFIDSELEWSPSSLININILVNDRENQKCRKKISSTSVQNSKTLSNVLSKKSVDLSTKVKNRFVSACKKTCNKVKCSCKRPSNLYSSQKSTASNLILEGGESSKKEMQSADAVVFRKLPDMRDFHQSHNVDGMPICGHINDVQFSNEETKPCAKRVTVGDQRSTSMKHRFLSRGEVKLESRESDNIDSISFCGNIMSPNDMQPYKPYGISRTGKAHECSPMKYGGFSRKGKDVGVCESKNIEAISLYKNIDDSKYSNNVTPCEQCHRSGIFTANRGEWIKHRYFCGNGVKAEPCESGKIDSITPRGNINKASLNNVKLCKPCEKTKPVGTQMIHRPFSMRAVKMESCKFNNRDSLPICENINKVEFCDDVRIYESCERSTMVEPQNTAIMHSCFPGQCAKSEILESNNTDAIPVLKNANHLESCEENKPCESCKKRGFTVEAQRALFTKHRCFSKKEMEFDSCKFYNSQTSIDTKLCECNDLDKELPNVNKGEMITQCNINRSNPQVSNNCDSSAEKLPLKNCPRIRLSKADQRVCAYENGISPPKFINPQISPSTAKAPVKLQMSQVNALDVREATGKTESALLDDKLCRKVGSPDLTKSCTCTVYSQTFIPIYYANTERISCFSFSEKEAYSDEGTDYTKSLSEETDIETTLSQSAKPETQIVTGISSMKTSISRQRINEEGRIFTEVSGISTHDTTVFNFIEILTQSEQKFMPDENERQFVNKKEESEYSTLDSDSSEYRKKQIVDSVADNSASSSDIERCYLENQELESKRTIPMSNKKSNKIGNKQKMKKKKEFLNNYEKQRSIIMRKRLKPNNKQTPTSTPSSEKNMKKIRKVISEYLDTSSTSILNNNKFSNSKKCKLVLSTSKHIKKSKQVSSKFSNSKKSKLVLSTSKHIMKSKQVFSKGRTMSLLQKSTTLAPHKKEIFYSPYSTNPTLYHVAVESLENINQADAPNQKTKFRIAFFFKKSKGKIINWFRYLHTTKLNVNTNDNNNGKNDDEADRALAARINLMKQRKILSSKLRQTDSQTSKLYLYNKFYEEKGRTELIISKSEMHPTPVLQEINSHEIIVPSLEDDLREEESGGDQKDEEKLAGPSVPSDDSSILFIRKEVYDRLQRYGKLHYTLYIGEKNELDHISIESLEVSEEKIKCDDQPFFASFDLGTKDVLVHVTKDTIDKMEDEEVKEAVFKDESYVACENSQVRLSLMRGAKYLQKLDPTQANIIEIDCSNKLHEIKICYKKVEHSKTCICEYPQVCKNIQLESSDLSSIVIEKIDKILDAREVCENCERCKEKNEVCDDYQECSDEKCAMKRDDYGEVNLTSQFDNELKAMDITNHTRRVEYEDISIKSSECCDAVCSKKLERNIENEEEDNVKTIQFMQVTQRCGFQEEKCPETVGRKPTSELHKEHKGGICNEKEKQIDLRQLNHLSQKPDSFQKRDLEKNVTSKLGSKTTFYKNENHKSPVSKKKKMQKRNAQRYNNNHKPTLILTLTHYKSILNIRS